MVDDGLHRDNDHGVLRDPAAHSDHLVHRDRATPDGESGDKPRTGEQSAQVSQTGGSDVGHSGAVLFSMPVAL